MSRLNEYLDKVYNEERHLPAGQAEFIGTNKGGINAAGEIRSKNLRSLVEQIANNYKMTKGANIPSSELKRSVSRWIEVNHPDVWEKIQEVGGFDRLMGDKYPPADIQIVGKNEDEIIVTPDA